VIGVRVTELHRLFLIPFLFSDNAAADPILTPYRGEFSTLMSLFSFRLLINFFFLFPEVALFPLCVHLSIYELSRVPPLCQPTRWTVLPVSSHGRALFFFAIFFFFFFFYRRAMTMTRWWVPHSNTSPRRG